MTKIKITIIFFILVVFTLSSQNASSDDNWLPDIKLNDDMSTYIADKTKTDSDKIQDLAKRLKLAMKSSNFINAINYADALVLISSNLNRQNPKDHAFVIVNAAMAYGGSGNKLIAERYLSIAIKILDGLENKSDLKIVDVYTTYAKLLVMNEKKEAAEEWLLKTVKLVNKYNYENQYKKDEVNSLVNYFYINYVKGDKGESLSAAYSLDKKAVELYNKRKFKDAIPYAEKALENLQNVFGTDCQLVIDNMAKLIMLYTGTYRFSEAEALIKKSLKISERLYGKDHPNTAITQNTLAAHYSMMDRYSEAEDLYLNSLEYFEKTFGKEHIYYSVGLSSLSQIYTATGRIAEAESINKKILEIVERKFGKEHSYYANSLGNLANIYLYNKHYDLAEPLLKKSLEISGKVLGNEHPGVIRHLQALGIFYMATKQYEKAKPLLLKALEIQEKDSGKDHLFVASNMINLAELYYSMGNDQEAESLFLKTLEIRERAFGKDKPTSSDIQLYLAKLYAALQRHEYSHELFIKSISISEMQRENIFQVLSERQKAKYMQENNASIHMFLSHTGTSMGTSFQAVIDAFNVWLRWKGLVADVQGRYMNSILYTEDPEVNKKIDQLISFRKELGRLFMEKPESINLEDYKGRIESTEKQKESLEVELYKVSNNFLQSKKIATADYHALIEMLPQNSVYIDFANIRTFDFIKKDWGDFHYFAFVLIPGEKVIVKLVEIADTATIDKLIKAYRTEMKTATLLRDFQNTSELSQGAMLLYEAVMKPLEQFIKDKKQLFISPDGNLNLLPFEVLLNSDRKYMIDNYVINYIGSGRDIMRFSDTQLSKGKSLIIADPDYDMGLKDKNNMLSELRMSNIVRGAVSRDFKGLLFPRLKDTKQEADSIESVLTKKLNLSVVNYQDQKAIEEVLFSINSPRILHIATHGFFLSTEKEEVTKVTGTLLDATVINNNENPMLRSGIVLGGVNASIKEKRDDGIVSAEKILGLKLKGTDLVVLSACETGVGDIQSGEGVFGLKRAFIMSGAKTLITSLWSVPSKETTEIMSEFYTLMAEGRTKSDALREAKVNALRKYSHPFYWGAFTLTGNPN